MAAKADQAAKRFLVDLARLAEWVGFGLAMLLLIVVAFWMFASAFRILGGHVFYEKVNGTKTLMIAGTRTFAVKVIQLVSEALLIVIVMELVATIARQIGGKPLTPELLKDLLIIGIVAAVRHLLAVGAELSFGPGPLSGTPAVPRSALIGELAVNGGVVLALAIAWIFVYLAVHHVESSVPPAARWTPVRAGMPGREETARWTIWRANDPPDPAERQ